MDQVYPQRKHLTIIERGDKTYFRVQINKAKQGLKVNKTFKDYENAIEFLNACENKIGQVSVKAFIEQEHFSKAIIEDYFKEPPLIEYFKEYLRIYIEPKYQHLSSDVAKDRYKKRQKNNLITTYKRILNTKVLQKVSNDFELNELIYTQRQEKTLSELKPKEITEDTVNQLIIKLREQGLKPISISDYISRMSVFWKKLKYLDKKLSSLQNPFLNYDKDLISLGEVKTSKKPFRFTTEKLRQVVKVFKRNGNPEFRAIIHLMYKLGLRRQEAILLEKSQITDKPSPRIYIFSKNQERIVRLNQRQWNFVKSLIKPNKERLFDYEVLGFEGSFTKPFRQYKINQHSFRKDYISRMIEKIGLSNSILASQLLGYSTPRAIEKLKGLFPDSPEISTQEQLLSQIGHTTSRITAQHYFSFKTDV